MKNKDKIIIIKIQNYIKELYIFFDGYGHKEFNEDKKKINACVFNLSQIGELAGKVSENLIKENPRN